MGQLLVALVSVSLATRLTVWSADSARWKVSLAVPIAADVAFGLLIAAVTCGLAGGLTRRRIFRRKSGRHLYPASHIEFAT